MRKLFGTGVAILATMTVVGASPVFADSKEGGNGAGASRHAPGRRMIGRRRARAKAAPAISPNR
jgi:hypothetical protein